MQGHDMAKTVQKSAKPRDASRKPRAATAPRRPSKPPANPTHADIAAYHAALSSADRRICDLLAGLISTHLPDAESKIWHRHPVWFLDGNPIVGYHKLKDSVRLLFWSGQSFDEPALTPEGTLKVAEARFTAADQISPSDLKRWLAKSATIQWDYKNIVKRKGKLERLKYRIVRRTRASRTRAQL